MRASCAHCHERVTTPKGKRYFQGEQLHKWEVFVPYAEIYKFNCRHCRRHFYVLSYFDANINTNRVYSKMIEDGMWNDAQKTKPGKEPYSTTASEYTLLAKRDTAQVFDKLLKRVS